MTKTNFIVLAVLALALLIGTLFWQASKQLTNAKHCREMLGGIVLREADSGRFLCLRKDVVLRVY
jgi:hypothetical protein